MIFWRSGLRFADMGESHVPDKAMIKQIVQRVVGTQAPENGLALALSINLARGS